MRTGFITLAHTAIVVGIAAGLQVGPRHPAAAQVSSRCPATNLDAKKTIARGWHESLNQQNLDVLDGLLASDILHHSATFPDTEGPAGVKRVLGAALTGFPDVRFTVEDVIAEGDLVAVRFRADGSHLGEFQGYPPTGRPVVWTGINIFRIECGRIVESWSEVDGLGRLEQLGVLPSRTP
jgi:steroid delta-isomerase-like uncharacterized protein